MRVGRRVRRAHAGPVGRAGAGRRAHADARSGSRRSRAISRPGRSDFSAPRRGRHGRVRDRVVGAQRRTAGRTCSTTGCAWPRRCSCTCGRRCSQRIAELAGGRRHRRHRHPHAPRRGRRDGRAVPSRPSGSRRCAAGRSTTTPTRRTPRRAGGSTTTASRCRRSRRARRWTAAVRGRADAAARLQGRRPEHRARLLRRRRAARGARHAARAAVPRFRTFAGCRVGGVTDETRDGRRPAGAASGAGRTGRSRATSSRARCPGRSGSGWTAARSSSASTRTPGSSGAPNPFTRLGDAAVRPARAAALPVARLQANRAS